MIEPELGNNVNPAGKLECVPKWIPKNHQKSATGNLETHGSFGSQILHKSPKVAPGLAISSGIQTVSGGRLLWLKRLRNFGGEGTQGPEMLVQF